MRRVGRAARWTGPACACLVVALAGCREGEEETSAAPLPPVASSVVLAAPSVHGSIEISHPGTTGGVGQHREIAAAYAYLVEQWPVADEVEPSVRLLRIDLLLDPDLDHGCQRELTTASPRTDARLTRVVLEGQGRQPLKWETDIAVGDDLRLCLDDTSGGCDEAPLRRGEVVLSIGRERVRGLIRAAGPRAGLRGHFVAEVCLTPAGP